MTLVSIDIGAMEDLVSDMRSAHDDLPSDVSTIRGRLDQVLIGTGSVAQVDFGSAIWTWMSDRIRDLDRRLALARLIAGSTPGIPGVGVVEIDESYVSDLSQAEVDSLAEEVEVLMTPAEFTDPQDIDPRLLEILAEHAHDPYFAAAVAGRVSACTAARPPPVAPWAFTWWSSAVMSRSTVSWGWKTACTVCPSRLSSMVTESTRKDMSSVTTSTTEWPSADQPCSATAPKIAAGSTRARSGPLP